MRCQTVGNTCLTQKTGSEGVLSTQVFVANGKINHNSLLPQACNITARDLWIIIPQPQIALEEVTLLSSSYRDSNAFTKLARYVSFNSTFG
ncbi:hypothetical protein POVWA2_054810 [Plasmodium ovale wallikeri]|uniref:Uncharacterized protein n=1 Tax=Plasmodium ovale wallikeri TaxID=864142 RepID=A0A1A8ZVB8_PLAOA|nr:hypothetical protein POVWA1_055920 [Plasmodium ovale wallikeri]SBT47781.1 hypothetical protein POVWA2_054810 [Plasmodium ovale wallikeri]